MQKQSTATIGCLTGLILGLSFFIAGLLTHSYDGFGTMVALAAEGFVGGIWGLLFAVLVRIKRRYSEKSISKRVRAIQTSCVGVLILAFSLLNIVERSAVVQNGLGVRMRVVYRGWPVSVIAADSNSLPKDAMGRGLSRFWEFYEFQMLGLAMNVCVFLTGSLVLTILIQWVNTVVGHEP